MTHLLRTCGMISTVTAAALLSACGGGGSSSDTNLSGTLGVAITDAPACGFDAVNVTVNKVRVHQSATAGDTDAGWTDITLSPARKINLLNLTNGALENLGQTPLTPGRYTQLRLVLDANAGSAMANSVVPSGTVNEVSLDTPSAVQSGIKLVNQFDVAAGQRVDLVLDFDACKSVVRKGNGGFALKPVVKVVPTVLNGINGFVPPALLTQHVMVTAQQNGTIVAATAPNATTGEFYLARLVPGNYDVVITADNSATAVIAAVPVATATSTTTLSSASAPINLVAAATAPGIIGGTVALAPVSSTEVATVSAKQSFAAGPTVTVKYQGVDIATGAYALTLPTVAPQLAPYSATLPLVFTAQANTLPGTGKYKVEAAANGYAVQTLPSVDIATANQLGVSFTLIP
ncbi:MULTISPECIES: DUF4382 domain-containing protein [unclassified Janthinobacterium]|uniref:DUF4382 domain-containing protein n=1 Tax=unclassified Janthinobacterium TaxID=2610881 RepID=UPI001E59F1F6|nr:MULTISPECIES: DUF4382 domain-containing protein [unclassified Janthinobacterium]MCC7641980.1 DUF4382 domain-containing protein [Janthinobacterium sp. EB271-G4-3-1]MCC7690106.1 DUF4382 domain-containing protein [Janthinobacterium sp. EB271-G4-3-2]